MNEQKSKILVIEDEMTFAKVIKMRLERSGYNVEVAGDAYQGTQSIIRNQYDLIIFDLMMPAGGGFSMLQRVRKIPAKSDIPVILMTGKHLDDTDKSMALDLDVRAIFTKPFDTVKFLDMVHDLTLVAA